MQIDINRIYTRETFRDDLRKCYWNSGIQNFPTVFLINDSQILYEQFLEDLNSVLDTGEVANLFEEDEYEKVILNSRSAMVESGTFKDQSRDQIYDYFVARVKSNLHIVFCMSPVGNNFRERW
jgi:dynein heavy chain